MTTNQKHADHDPTDAEIIRAIADAASKAGFDSEELRGILLAERANGILRVNCPKWLRRTQYFLATKGQLYPDGIVARATADWFELLGPEAPEDTASEPGRQRGAAD